MVVLKKGSKCIFISFLLRFEWQSMISQSASADRTHPSFNCHFYATVHDHFLSVKLLLTKGARLILHEWERRTFQTHGRCRTFVGLYDSPGDMLICFWKCTMFVSGSHVVVNRLSLTVITAGAGPDPQADGVPLHLPGGWHCEFRNSFLLSFHPLFSFVAVFWWSRSAWRHAEW